MAKFRHIIHRLCALQEWERLHLLSSVEIVADMLGASRHSAAPLLNFGGLTKSPE